MKMTAMDILKVIFGVLVAWVYTEVQHYVVPFEYRVTCLIVAYLLIFLMIFVLIKPSKPYALSRWLSFWLTLVALVIILIEDIGLKQTPISHLVRGTTTIIGSTLIAPFVVGWVYTLIRKK